MKRNVLFLNLSENETPESIASIDVSKVSADHLERTKRRIRTLLFEHRIEEFVKRLIEEGKLKQAFLEPLTVLLSQNFVGSIDDFESFSCNHEMDIDFSIPRVTEVLEPLRRTFSNVFERKFFSELSVLAPSRIGPGEAMLAFFTRLTQDTKSGDLFDPMTKSVIEVKKNRTAVLGVTQGMRSAKKSTTCLKEMGLPIRVGSFTKEEFSRLSNVGQVSRTTVENIVKSIMQNNETTHLLNDEMVDALRASLKGGEGRDVSVFMTALHFFEYKCLKGFDVIFFFDHTVSRMLTYVCKDTSFRKDLEFFSKHSKTSFWGTGDGAKGMVINLEL